MQELIAALMHTDLSFFYNNENGLITVSLYDKDIFLTMIMEIDEDMYITFTSMDEDNYDIDERIDVRFISHEDMLKTLINMMQ